MLDITSMTKEQLIEIIKKKGCSMLKDKLNGDETKKEIIEYLIHCKCPVIKKLLSK